MHQERTALTLRDLADMYEVDRGSISWHNRDGAEWLYCCVNGPGADWDYENCGEKVEESEMNKPPVVRELAERLVHTLEETGLTEKAEEVRRDLADGKVEEKLSDYQSREPEAMTVKQKALFVLDTLDNIALKYDLRTSQPMTISGAGIRTDLRSDNNGEEYTAYISPEDYQRFSQTCEDLEDYSVRFATLTLRYNNDDRKAEQIEESYFERGELPATPVRVAFFGGIPAVTTKFADREYITDPNEYYSFDEKYITLVDGDKLIPTAREDFFDYEKEVHNTEFHYFYANDKDNYEKALEKAKGSNLDYTMVSDENIGLKCLVTSNGETLDDELVKSWAFGKWRVTMNPETGEFYQAPGRDTDRFHPISAVWKILTTHTEYR